MEGRGCAVGEVGLFFGGGGFGWLAGRAALLTTWGSNHLGKMCSSLAAGRGCLHGCSAAPHGLLSALLLSFCAGRPVTEEPEGTMEEKHYKRIINQVRRARQGHGASAAGPWQR